MAQEARVKVGPFELVEQIGTGGMADVWRGVHADTHESVAVKIITGARALQQKYRDRFVQEVQAVARLDHPGIVPVYDYGESEVAGGAIREGSPYLIMELADRGVLEPDEVTSYEIVKRVLLQLLDALAYSHARGVIHRDLKPMNVLLVTDPLGGVRAKLTDFGIAHADDPETDLTRGRLAEAAGTPDYMPPEQLRGEWRDFGPWTDLYALGCMAWELITGRLPFVGPTRMVIALAHITEPLPPFHPRFEVPPGLERWLARLLAKEGADRFQCAADAAFALSRLDFNAADLGHDHPAAPVAGSLGFEDSGGWDDDDVADTTIVVPGRIGALLEESSGALEEVARASATVLAFDAVSMLIGADENLEVPPIPASWQHEETERSTIGSGLGLSLFGLREIPFVDRQYQRDELWRALRDVETSGKPRAVILRGPSGVGKSRTAQWITRRAAEVGGAQILYASHGPSEGAKHGLSHMLERWFVTWRMDNWEAVTERLRGRLARVWSEEVDSADPFLDHEARSLAAITASPADVAAGDLVAASPEERLTTVERLLTQLSKTRTVAVWIDDAHWGEEALALAERVIASDHARVLLILTVQDEAIPTEGSVGPRLEHLGQHRRSRVLGFGPLGEEDQRILVRRLLQFDDTTTASIARATAGNPLFAVQVVTDWVEQGIIVPAPHGFALRGSADIETNFQGLWLRRIDRLAARLGGYLQRIAIELAATLGNEVSDVEWEACCLVADIRPHERLVDEMVDQGLVIRSEGGWSFVHRTLPDSLRDAAAKSDRWAGLHQCCAEVLLALYPNFDGMKGRVAGHFLAAGAWEAALSPLAVVARAALATGDIKLAAETIRQRADALQRASVPADDPRGAENLLLEATLHLVSGNATDAEQALDVVVASATAHGWEELAARSYRLRGELRASNGRLDEAVDDLAQAEIAIAGVADPLEHAALCEARAWTLRTLGDVQGARAELESALDLYRDSNDTARELNVFNRLAYTFLAEGDFEASREVAEMGVELSRQASNRQAEAGCLTTLGTIARLQGNLDVARERYQEAARLDELSGSRHLWVVRTHFALLELAAENWDVARAGLEGAADELSEAGWGWMISLVRLGEACCAAALGEWAEYDALWASAMTEIASKHLVERELATLAEQIGEVTTQAKQLSRARQALHFAMNHWNALGDGWRARELRIQLRSLSVVGQ